MPGLENQECCLNLRSLRVNTFLLASHYAHAHAYTLGCVGGEGVFMCL